MRGPDESGDGLNASTERRPLDDVLIRRAFSFADEAIRAAAVQLERAREEGSDPARAAQWWIDLQFFIVALRRMRTAAQLASKPDRYRREVYRAIARFDNAVPKLRLLRNVGEHIDEYSLGIGHDPSIQWRQLQVGKWDGKVFYWLDVELNVEEAMTAAERLLADLNAVRQKAGSYCPGS